MTCGVVTAVCYQPEAFASDLGSARITGAPGGPGPLSSKKGPLDVKNWDWRGAGVGPLSLVHMSAFGVTSVPMRFNYRARGNYSDVLPLKAARHFQLNIFWCLVRRGGKKRKGRRERGRARGQWSCRGPLLLCNSSTGLRWRPVTLLVIRLSGVLKNKCLQW